MRICCRTLPVFTLLLVALDLAPVHAVPSWAGPLDSFLPAGSQHHPDVPTPPAYLQFEVGERHAYVHEIMGYFRALEAASPRVKVIPYGRSHGDRELVLAVITAPENLRNLDALLAVHRAASEPGARRAAEAEAPLVVWLGYGVHGNEPSASNAAFVVGYHFAAASDAETEALLRRTIIIIDPILNPDGHDRYAAWVNDHRGRVPNPDPQTREHIQAFPTGRVNYYWFDLNRDWMPLVHPESQGRIAQFHRWRPHVLGDFHEMGSNTTYFFQPGVPTRVNPQTPPRNQELTAAIAEHHAAALDRAGAMYYTKETFDDFYLGKGSAYPDLFGSVGILFEQARVNGHLQSGSHGLATFGAAIRNQVTTSYSTVSGADAIRSELKAFQRDFYVESARLAAANPIQFHVLGAPGDPAKLDAFVRVLAAHQIEVRGLTRAVTLNRVDFAPGEAVVIPVAQREYRFLQGLLQDRTDFEENVFYDLSTWTLSATYNLQRADVANLPPGVIGPVVARIPTAGPVPARETTVGWVMEATGLYVPRALYRLLERGFFVKVTTQPMAVRLAGTGAAQALERGAYLVPAALQGGRLAELHELLSQIAAEDGVRIHALGSFAATSGPDLGSPSMGVVGKPSILLAMGPGVAQTEAGALWHLLDHDYRMPVALVETTRLGRVDLARYTVVILPPGSYGNDEQMVENLTGFVQAGGTLIAIGNAAEWVAARKLAPVEQRRAERDPPGARPFAEAETDRALELVSGAILRVEADLTHPLLFGYRDPELTLLRSQRVILEPSKSPYQTPLRVAAQPLVSGYLSARNQAALAGSAAALVERVGRGQVIVLADHPAFRGLSRGANRLLFNAIYHGAEMRLRGQADYEGEDAGH